MIILKFNARITPDGALVPGLLTSVEFSLWRHINFLLDTGSAISALSVKDLGTYYNYSGLEKKREAPIGVGGSLECYLIHNVRLFLFSSEQKWIEVKQFSSMCLLPPSIDQLTGEHIFLPSLIGRDIIGVDLDLNYAREAVFLERYIKN